ncbi:hypothetical protein [Flavivirga eckloniae]|uniref:Uncharacterized protein n=1 Tax=Flavivirga eckloniae TaxID=1803846 RepID=A0A2K9PUN9_9FLAO|nr:hypothetical protein [Flavivirga eckloniae]AUP80795.1 hypothetical protein C1H87_19585 [Flavivirga eckloniae]
MKINILFFVFFICFISITAQNTKSNKIEIAYTQLPTHPLEKDIKSYKLAFKNQSAIDFSGVFNPESKISIDGFEKKLVDPDFTVHIDISGFESKSYVTTNKTGGLGASATQTYVYIIEGILQASTYIYDSRDGSTYYLDELKNIDELTIQNRSKQSYNTEDEAKKALNLAKKKELNLLNEAVKKQFLSFISMYLNTKHGYSLKKEHYPIWSIKSKKFDYAKIDEAASNYNQAVVQISADGTPQSAKDLLKKSVLIWEDAVKQYDPNNKKARISTKNVGALYLNLVMANVWLQDFDKASLYFDKAKKAKGQFVWKPVIEKLLYTQKAGIEQDELRKKGALVIEKLETTDPNKKSYATDFLVSNQKYRLKGVYFYEKRDRNAYSRRKHYDYTKSGILTAVLNQTYLSKNFAKGSKDVKFEYDNDVSRIVYMSYYDFGPKKDKGLQPVKYRYIKQGKIIKEEGFENTLGAHDYTMEMIYNDNGQWLGFKKKSKETLLEGLDIKYEKEKVINFTKTLKLANNNYSHQKYVYSYENDRISKVDMYQDEGDNPTFQEQFGTINYTYNNDGLLIKTKMSGPIYNEYIYDANKNLIEVVKHQDTNHERITFEWEAGSGNETLIKFDTRFVFQSLLYPIPIY